MDLGKVTVKELLEKKVGPDGAKRVLKAVTDSYKSGKRGEELHEDFKDAMIAEGHDVGSDDSDIVYSFFIP